MGKEAEVLEARTEIEIFRRDGKGCLTHMWFAMDPRVRVRVYVDGEAAPSIDMALDLGCGYGFGGPEEPFGSPKMGRYGGHFNSYLIPYGDGVRVTLLPVTETFERVTGRKIWWIVRGTENLSPVIAGQALPQNARLKLHRLEAYRAEPLEEFNLCNVRGHGLLSLVTMAAQGQRKSGNAFLDLSYMEGCIRAYLNNEEQPEMLSSGLEDYFLGSGYFHQNHLYFGAVAGLTYLDKANNAFSAYRFHDDDPVFFQNGFRLTCRCGEELNGAMLHDPPATLFDAYTWLYQW